MYIVFLVEGRLRIIGLVYLDGLEYLRIKDKDIR